MLQRNIIILFFFLIIQANYCQNQAANWYFGDHAGLSFNTGTPIALTDGELNTWEGCSTISDENGDLLFYSDGITVWDKNHSIMLNGTGLLGNISSTQSAIIVPKPEDPNIYYVFTVDELANSNGLRYSEVNLLLNSGNGAVTSNKNILLSTPTTEKISAVQHSNGVDFWVIAHDWNSNDFLAYHVSNNGVNPNPVISSSGIEHNGVENNAIGYLKIAPNGEKLALAISSGDIYAVEIFNFSTSTGVVSNPITITGLFSNTNSGCYGVEFSPNSEVLYISDIYGAHSKVHQFDISLANQTQIINSHFVLYENSGVIAALQLAIDEKIYVANWGNSYLDVIENPNILGSGSNYVDDGVSLGGRLCRSGLPPFIQSYFSVGIKAENFCFGDNTQFFAETLNDIDSISWDFGDGNTSTDMSPIHIYSAPGTYLVSAEIISGSNTRSLSKEVIITETPIANTITNYILCDDDSNDEIEIFDLSTKDSEILGSQSASNFSVSYFENITDAENHTNPLNINFTNTINNQEIFAKISNINDDKCYNITSFNLIVAFKPVINIEDYIICDDVSNDETELVDLTQFNQEILDGQLVSNFNITYHLTQNDADNNLGTLPNNFQTLINPQTIFVRMENSIESNCFDTASFDIIIDDYFSANQANNMYLCDETNDGVELFDLTLQNEQILLGLPDQYNITYHLNQEDSEQNTNPIIGIYENESNSQEIFYRVERVGSVNCYQTSSFFIEVLPTPIIDMNDVFYLCLNEELILFVDDNFDSYLWSTGETSASISVDTPGTYSLTVTNNYLNIPASSCSSTKTITVIESDEAIIENIEILDFTFNNNTISVFVNGFGDYEFSLDGIYYQDESIFNNLNPGEYTIYIRDKNGCGIITHDVYILFYPRFFSPNGDGINDHWQIYFSRNEPNLKIKIFDRFGKFITELNSQSLGWDGLYNGKRLPATDYWFIIERPSNGKRYTGHFTLKR